MEFSRRTFMKIAAMGGASLATDAGAKNVGRLVPYLIPPEKFSPVDAITIATTCRECPAGCGMHIRHSNGRITKAEGNPDHPVNRGGLCARGQSALQGVYDPDRVKEVRARERSGPLINSSPPLPLDEGRNKAGLLHRKETWQNAMAGIKERLQQGNGRVAILSRLETGMLAEIFSAFLSGFGSDRLLFYEAFHYASLRKAHAALFGSPVIPYYHLDQADYIISFAADFLESWISNVQFAYQFSEMHAFKNGKSGRFDYVGPRLSLTAANADRYIPVSPGKEKDIVLALLKVMLEERLVKTSRELIEPLVRNFDIRSVQPHVTEENIRAMARRFGRGRSVALAGPVGAAGPEADRLALVVSLLNAAAGSIGTVMDFQAPHALSRTADDAQLTAFLQTLTPEDVLIIHKTNPVYTRPGSEEYLQKAGVIVYLGTMPDETAMISDWFLPVHDDLEAWGEYEPWAGIRGVMQPTMQAPAGSKDAGDVLTELAAAARKDLRRRADGSDRATACDWLQDRRRERMAQSDWEDVLRSGGAWSVPKFSTETGPATIRADGLRALEATSKTSLANDQAYLWLWPSIMLFDGRTANRGWIQETPEPVSTFAWDSWIDMHPGKARALEIQQGDMLELISEENGRIQAAVRVTDDVSAEVVALSFGQGHTALGSTAAQVGTNAFTLLAVNASPSGMFGTVRISKLVRKGELVRGAATREQHDREILQWKHADEAAAMKPAPLALPLAEEYTKERDLYKPHQHKTYRWAMTIDLDRCIGCGACAVACYAENNIPVVGKKQFGKGRHLAWLRVVPYRLKEDHPKIAWLPMLCQHCDSAPCEPVCPVFAAVHNEDGLNSQIYNRCIGTRYCSNNCPYKVRRFNWVNIQWKEPLTWQLNPEVTVRVRGVMEKCTFCVQRIRSAEYRAKRENRKVRDGEIVPACAQSCPAKVFTFGNLLDPESAVSRITRNDPRRYHVLEELNTKPAITYLVKIVQDKKA